MITPALNLTDAQGTPLASFAARLQSRESLPPLVPKEPWNEGLEAVLEGTDETDLLGDDTADREYALSVKSGLLLWNDSMSVSHNLSQGITNDTGSYWHGIMHRREPDFSNAKYWFRRVGEHEIFPQLYEQATGIFQSVEETSEYAQLRLKTLQEGGGWDPFAFVDWCEAAVKSPTHADEAELLAAVQLREIELLITHSYRKAVGSGG